MYFLGLVRFKGKAHRHCRLMAKGLGHRAHGLGSAETELTAFWFCMPQARDKCKISCRREASCCPAVQAPSPKQAVMMILALENLCYIGYMITHGVPANRQENQMSVNPKL